MIPERCWVCAAPTRPFWTNDQFQAVACAGCGHIHIQHHAAPAAAAQDYHRGYEQDHFVASLAATRRRQAGRILDALESLGGVDALFDYGCGRGWFLEVAKLRGVPHLAGGDFSELALELIRSNGIRDVRLAFSGEPQRLDADQIGFPPQVVTFLDVVEHFEGDLVAKFTPWVASLPATVRLIVFKVPVREGLMFTISDLVRRVGMDGLGRRLFQAGTYPPHYQYFTRESLDAFVGKLGLRCVRTLDDLDYEPQELSSRLPATLAPLRFIATPAGTVLSSVAQALGRTDSRILVAERPRLAAAASG